MCSLCKKWLDEGWVVQSRLGCYSYNPFRSSPGLTDSNSVLVPAVCVCLVAWMNSESLPCDVPQVIPHFEERRGHAWPTTWLPLLAMPTCDCSSLVTACTSTVHPPSLDFTQSVLHRAAGTLPVMGRTAPSSAATSLGGSLAAPTIRRLYRHFGVMAPHPSVTVTTENLTISHHSWVRLCRN